MGEEERWGFGEQRDEGAERALDERSTVGVLDFDGGRENLGE